MKEMFKSAYDLGFGIGSRIFGAAMCKGEDPMVKVAKVAVMMDDANVQSALCKVAKYILEAGGEKGSIDYRIYDVIEKSAHPVSRFVSDTYIKPVIDTVNREVSLNRDDVQTIEKVAALSASSLPGIASIVGKSAGSVPNLVQLLLLIGGATGAATGGLTWYLNRAAKEDNVDAAAKEEQAAHYRRVAKDLQKRIQLEENKDKHVKAIRSAAEAENPDLYVV
ncbi:MAG: hypothetical protein MJZ17_05765 [Bacteroidales bacterium]|nr:hypothetical protein [Bacteroidales bacterium]